MEDIYILTYEIRVLANVDRRTDTRILNNKTLYFPNMKAATDYRVELNQAAQKLGIMEFMDVKIDKQPLVK